MITVLYSGVFHGAPDQIGRVRSEIRQYLDGCPVTDDVVLIASELFFPGFGSVSPKFAPTSRTKCRRRDGSQVTKPMLGLIATHPYWQAAEADLRTSAPLPRPPRRCLSRAPLIAECLMRHADRGEEFATNAIRHSASNEHFFQVRCEVFPDYVWVEVQDPGGVWHCRQRDGRPHGLDIVAVLVGDNWGLETNSDGDRIVWARVEFGG